MSDRLAETERLKAAGVPREEMDHLRRYPSDADDIAFVLCALNGEPTHLVTTTADLRRSQGS